MDIAPIETERLVIRNWLPRDRAPYAAFLADPALRKFFRGVIDAPTAHGWIAGYRDELAATGFGWRAIERKSDGALIGDVGIGHIDDASRKVMRGSPQVEAGWTVGRPFWGQGYATEAAAACLADAWKRPELDEIVAAAHVENSASHRVMEKLGMRRDTAGDFDDPRFPAGHWLRPHLLYRLARPAA
ncbi:GNAT family N-acetyltransferase [Dongia sp.]|uniref:GNAT family N-acetyltransferase n=1 Tax=Dongia sp. TaxID=1977262 RepID=UPI0035B147A9